jgi:hypothetical protein
MALVQVPGVNLNEVDAWDGSAGAVLPIGEYVFEVTAVTGGNAKTGTANLEFDLLVIVGADTETVNGATKKHWIYLTEKSAGRVRSMVNACGVNMTAEGAFDSDHFVGQQFIAEVYEDSFKKPNLETGETDTKVTNKIRKERPVSAGFSGQEVEAVPAAASTPAPRAPAPAAAPAAPAAPARPLPPGPRVAGAGALPRPQRPTLPGRKA